MSGIEPLMGMQILFKLMPEVAVGFVIIFIWSLIWKGIALWKAARTGSKPWFIILLLVNVFGILEIIYIFAVNPKWKLKNKEPKEN